MMAQIADVSNTLGSVHQMIKAGNRVHFESGLCYIEHVKTRNPRKIVEIGDKLVVDEKEVEARAAEKMGTKC